MTKMIFLAILLTLYFKGNSQTPTTKEAIQYFIDSIGRSNNFSQTGPLKAESLFELKIRDRIINCAVLNSTSTASKVKFDFLLDQFRRHLK